MTAPNSYLLDGTLVQFSITKSGFFDEQGKSSDVNVRKMIVNEWLKRSWRVMKIVRYSGERLENTMFELGDRTGMGLMAAGSNNAGQLLFTAGERDSY